MSIEKEGGRSLNSAPTHVTDDDNNSHSTPNTCAEWISGVMLADALEAEPEDVVREVLTADAWKAFRAHSNAFNRRIPFDAMFVDLDAVPVNVFDAAGLEFTREQEAEFRTNYFDALDDPHEVGEQLIAARAQRRRESGRVARDLRPQGVNPRAEYALTEVERVGGEEPYVAAAGASIDRVNHEVWGRKWPSSSERAPILTASQLHACGASPEAIAQMTPITQDQRVAAAEWLAISRLEYDSSLRLRAKLGNVPQTSLADDVLTVDELMELQPPRALVEGMIFEGTLAELVGAPGTSKSFVALDMAASIATGRSFAANPTKPGSGFATGLTGPVLYAAAEGVAGFGDRLSAWSSHRDVNLDELRESLFTVRRPVQLGDAEAMAELSAYVKKIGAVMVVIDTRARSTNGLNENEATDQSIAINNADDLIRVTGAAVLTIHHTTRGSTHGRGSTAWFGAVQSSLRIDPRDDNTIRIICDKQKDSEDGCAHEFSLTTVEGLPGRGPSRVVEALDAQDAAERDQISAKSREVLEVIGDMQTIEGMTPTDIKNGCAERGIFSGSSTSSSSHVTRLVKAGLIENVGTDSRRRYTTKGYRDTQNPALALRTPEHLARVEIAIAEMCALIEAGQINDKTPRITIRDTFVKGLSREVFDAAYERWHSSGRPDDTGTVSGVIPADPLTN